MRANKLYSTNQKIRGWGTILDYQNKVPPMFVGKSFQEASHGDILRFNQMSDQEKWEMGFWIEFQTQRKSLIFGIVFGITVVFVVSTLFSL